MSPDWLVRRLDRLRVGLGARHLLREIAAGSAWLLADRLFRMLFGLAVSILIARHLGPASYGALSYAIAFVVIFGFLGTLGLDAIVIRELAGDPARRQVVMGSALALKAAGGVIAYAVAVGTAIAIKGLHDPTVPVIAILSASFLFQSLDVFDQWFQSQSQFRYIAALRSAAFLAAALTKIAFIHLDLGVPAFAAATVVEAAVAAVLLALAYRMTAPPGRPIHLDRREALGLLRHSWPLAISSLFVLLTMQLDKIFVGHFLDLAQVGIYSVASQLSSTWYMVPVIVGAAAAPALTRLRAAGDGAYFERLQSLYSTLTMASLLIAALLTVFSGPLVHAMFGPGFADAGPILAVHTWTAVFVFHVSIRTRALIAEGKERYVTAMAGMTLATSVLLSGILIPRNGAMGAAQAALLSWAACAALFPLAWSETRRSAAMFIASFWPRTKP